MTPEPNLILLIAFIVVCVGFTTAFAIMCWKVLKQNLLFHSAGNKMHEYELDKARIDLQRKQAENDAIRVETERVRTVAAQRKEGARTPTPTGGTPRPLT
jgi:hypothetical protein